MVKQGTKIILPTATYNPHMPDWDKCAVKGCPAPRVLGSQGCRLHRNQLTRRTCSDVVAIPDPTPSGDLR